MSQGSKGPELFIPWTCFQYVYKHVPECQLSVPASLTGRCRHPQRGNPQPRGGAREWFSSPLPPTHLDAHEQGGDGEATGRGERQGESSSVSEPFCFSQATSPPAGMPLLMTCAPGLAPEPRECLHHVRASQPHLLLFVGSAQRKLFVVAFSCQPCPRGPPAPLPHSAALPPSADSRL